MSGGSLYVVESGVRDKVFELALLKDVKQSKIEQSTKIQPDSRG